MIVLGKRIKQARKRAGFTQEKMAEAIGVSRTAVTKWEAGESEPTLEKLVKISALLKVSADYLLGIEDRAERNTVLENMASILMELASDIRTELGKEQENTHEQ